ncbi:SpaA isopeptide-forming pilin-related protein [Metaclostridioides mangenotii]|uniref:Repeat protein (TIGR01451 family) n=1 Tax=Metaclostridioides mangenotii TaxID=1540 RepID=A0ABS4E7P3_9FIRM|nr:SpaA isopeptide-forming pilin-related protein [Clostridioides mangenotii]MBP1853961.1 putative repeat protein (TIGR01451 family) [Clostridioides mangenotii]
MRRRNIKQKICSYITIFTMMFQFFTFLPILQVNAEENITEFTKFITGVSITDGEGEPISGPIKNNADVKLQYNFELPNEHNIKNGQSYIMHIPKEFEIINHMNFLIGDDSGEVIANGTIDIDGKVTIVFTEFVEQHSNISGYFFIETKFDEKEIGGNDRENIEFDLGGSGNSETIVVEFEQPEKPDASIHKKGSYDATTNEITWEIIVNPENVKVQEVKIVDVISEGQEFVVGSVKINGQDANNKDYGYDSNEGELTYTFPDTIETKQLITFKTKLASMGLESHGKTIVEKNQATFIHDDTTVVSNEATVLIKPDFIQKIGKYDEATKTIKWTIKVNNSSQTITNTVVTDDIPDGLKFIDGSVKVDGKSTEENYSIDGQKFIYTFPDTINGPHTIEFSTNVVDKDIYLSNEGKNFNNTATITENGNGSASDGSEVGVYSSVISKHGTVYDASTGEITWEIVVNRNKIDIEDAVVTDDIMKGQEYVKDSFSIYNHSTNESKPNGKFSYRPSTSDDSTKTGTLTYKFDDKITDTYVVKFKTRVTDPKIFASNADVKYHNTAKLTGKNIKDSESTAEQKVISQVINKSSIDYDYVKREITWKIVVNKNNMPLSNASVIDVIKEGQEFVPNSVTINGAIDTSNYNYDEGSKTLKYTFDKDINKEQIITFKTKVTDTSIFNTNGEKVVENTSKLITNLVPGGVESTGTGKIKNTLVKKEGKYTKGNSYIDWDVTINSNKISMKDVVLEDALQEGLELDTTSVKLYKQNQNSDGSLTKGEEVELGGNNVKYDMKTRKFSFILPSPTEDAYILTFRTNVVDKTKSPFTNSISFKGVGMTESSTSNGIDVIYQGAGGGGIGETGSIKVIKVNNDNVSIKLEGAIFELLDKYKNVIKTSEPTGNNGDAVFKNLKFGIDYYIKEKTAPEGYLLSNEVYKFQIANSKESKNINYNYKNISVKGDIIFNKLNENEKPLKGAEFTLYKASDISFESPIDTSISDKNGNVKFKDIDYGEYVIKETKAPKGYTLNERILKATINENGKVVTANPDSISNIKIRGNIEFVKYGENKDLLKGAEFKLYKASDKNYENEIAKAESDVNGKVSFMDIEYGDYVIKETKAPEGYELTNKILKASITSNGKTIKANPESISNTKTKGSIEFTKLGEHEEKLKGAEFTLYKDTDITFKNPISTAVSDREGLVKFKNVEYGEYVIKESKAPEGYVLLSDDMVLKATVSENRKSVKADPECVSNIKIRGNIEFIKYGENKDLLKGAEFKLYKASDKNYEKEIDTAESNDSGKVFFGNIEYGDYIIKETKAPDGYELTNKILKASITSNGKTIKANPESISNTKTKGSIEFTKLGEHEDKLKGAEFKLYMSLDTDFKNPLATAVSNIDGLVKFKNVEYGEYVIKESKAPEGYVSLPEDKVLKATVTEDKKIVKAEPNSISNKKIRGSIEFTKYGDNKEQLKGAEFKLYKASDKNYEKEIDTAESNDSGKVFFGNIEYGDYIIKETKAPDGYELTNKILKASITTNGRTVETNPNSISNTKTKGSIEFTKLGEHEEPLNGAEFKLYKESDTRFKNPISTAVSNRNGLVKFKNVEYGKYMIKETKAPVGYILSDDILEATVTKSDKVVKANPESISNNKIRANIKITKIDEKTEKTLEGAEFTLYDADGKEVKTSISGETGIVYFNSVEYGNYKIKETKAPDGYMISKDIIEFKVKTIETKEFTVTNKEKEVVAVTKDNSPDKNGSLISKDNILDKLVSSLPKTGGLFDTLVIISIGILTILAGLGFLLKRNR